MRIFGAAVLMMTLAVASALAQVQAADVRDTATLRSFVERAASLTESRVANTEEVYDFADRTFRPEGEWRRGSIYLFIVRVDGYMLFQAGDASWEGTNAYDSQDSNGVYPIRELIRAAQRGGDFVEYLFDNPAVPGEDESLKVGYAVLLDLGGEQLVIGSGFHPATVAPIIPPLGMVLLALALGAVALYRRSR